MTLGTGQLKIMTATNYDDRQDRAVVSTTLQIMT